MRNIVGVFMSNEKQTPCFFHLRLKVVSGPAAFNPFLFPFCVLQYIFPLKWIISLSAFAQTISLQQLVLLQLNLHRLDELTTCTVISNRNRHFYAAVM